MPSSITKTKLIKTTTELKALKSSEDYKKSTVVFVPTMGALHEGHLSLMKEAKKKGDLVIVSIFVNPLQFGPNEDLDKYPKTLEADLEKCESVGVDYVFAPSEQELYPEGRGAVPLVEANAELSNRLCGLSREGHFDGVCTVVKLLFDLVEPKMAIFGEKDYQQFLVIEDMVKSKDLPVKVLSASTIREDSGLAMSSRNKYLSEQEKEKASAIYAELMDLRQKISEGIDEKIALIESRQKLMTSGFVVEYIETFSNRIFIAAKLGSTRLIDNIALSN